MATNAQPAPQASANNPITGFNDAALDKYLKGYLFVYDTGRTAPNPKGKRVANWTPEDFGVLPTEMLYFLRAAINSERYDIVDRLKPTAMSRAEFAHVILREATRRNNGDLLDYYQTRLDLPKINISIKRPLDVAPTEQRTVITDPTTATVFDAAIAVLKNPRTASIDFPEDVLKATNRLERNGYGIPMRTDTAAYDLGYTAGALPTMHNGAPLTIAIGFKKDTTTVQEAYCVVTNDIFNQGNNIDQREAFSVGFAQARLDAQKGNFQSKDVPIGLFRPCPQNTPAVTTQHRLALALK